MRFIVKNLITLLIMVFLTTPLVAQNGDKPERDRRPPGVKERSGERGPREGRGKRPGMDHRNKLLEKFKRERPQEYERLTKLREEDPEKFREEVMRIMRKKMANRSEGLLNRIKEEDPEKYKRLMTLKEEDPEKFREEVMKVFGHKMRGEHEERGKKHHESYGEIRALAIKYKEASESEKESLKAELRIKIEEMVSQELQSQVERAEKLETYLKSIKSQIKERQANKDKAVDEKLERIINADFKHPGKGHGKKDKLEKKEKKDSDFQ